MSDEELLAWVKAELSNYARVHQLRRPFYIIPIWTKARELFEAHPYAGNLEGLGHALHDAQYANKHNSSRALALAMLREFHTQYAITILTS